MQFVEKARKFYEKHGNKYLNLTESERLPALEKEYWTNLIERQLGDDIITEYAADLPLDKFGNGSQREFNSGNENFLWNLQNRKGSLL